MADGRWMGLRGGGIRCVAGLPICFVRATAFPVCCSVTTRDVASVFGLPVGVAVFGFFGDELVSLRLDSLGTFCMIALPETEGNDTR